MAQVNVKITGGSVKEMEADTVGELKTKLNLGNYTATINGEPAENDQDLEDYNFVVFSAAVKGGSR